LREVESCVVEIRRCDKDERLAVGRPHGLKLVARLRWHARVTAMADKLRSRKKIMSDGAADGLLHE